MAMSYFIGGISSGTQSLPVYVSAIWPLCKIKRLNKMLTHGDNTIKKEGICVCIAKIV